MAPSVYLCSCVFVKPEKDAEEGTTEEAAPLMAAELGIAAPTHILDKKPVARPAGGFLTELSHAWDIFKGVLCIFMVWSHVDLTLTTGTDQLYTHVGHTVGNVASGMCFLGFMISYGYSCHFAYLTNSKNRPASEQFFRMMRSACLPIMGAWICAFAWAFMFFKLPINWTTAISIFTFYNVFGNGPDFILSFTTTLLLSFTWHKWMNVGLDSKNSWKQCLTVGVMLLGPLLLTQFVVQNCTGERKYIMFFLECNIRDAWTCNLPALPHLFNFNLGVLLARLSAREDKKLKEGQESFINSPIMLAGIAGVLFTMAVPLFSAWSYNYGNLTVETKWGPVVRGFSGGPSPLWLVGNLFWLFILFIASVLAARLAMAYTSFCWITETMEHLGANVLLYLVMSDMMLAGLYSGRFDMHPAGAGVFTAGMMVAIRFVHYLGQSSRK
mmetsp:Transcript_51994/g.111342  ORF Transcript_51994/g.111342 Transcript_51994/m.111342 type:complete len:440 (-) Transcript_51994:80-1399(-)